MEQTDSYVKDTLNSYLQGLELSVAEVSDTAIYVALYTAIHLIFPEAEVS